MRITGREGKFTRKFTIICDWLLLGWPRRKSHEFIWGFFALSDLLGLDVLALVNGILHWQAITGKLAEPYSKNFQKAMVSLAHTAVASA